MSQDSKEANPHIKLRREILEYYGGGFLEEVAIGSNTLFYRRSKGGNCSYGKWMKWEKGDSTFQFLIGDFNVESESIQRSNLIKSFIEYLSSLPDLPEIEEDASDMDKTVKNSINFGSY